LHVWTRKNYFTSRRHYDTSVGIVDTEKCFTTTHSSLAEQDVINSSCFKIYQSSKLANIELMIMESRAYLIGLGIDRNSMAIRLARSRWASTTEKTRVVYIL